MHRLLRWIILNLHLQPAALHHHTHILVVDQLAFYGIDIQSLYSRRKVVKIKSCPNCSVKPYSEHIQNMPECLLQRSQVILIPNKGLETERNVPAGEAQT